MNNPYRVFQDAFARAQVAAPYDPTAMTLATVDEHGHPSARMVLLKEANEHGFVFYTNDESRKGTQIHHHPWVALCLYWAHIGEQVRIEGSVQPISAKESDAYFASRPRDSQIGAWASHQSKPLRSRDELLARVEDVRAAYDGKDVPRPPNWGGFRVLALRIEFWKDMPFRLHDRTLYRRASVTDTHWNVENLYP